MKKPKVMVVEIVPDTELKKKEKLATEAVRRLFPGCGAVALYRTAEGKVGFQLNVSVGVGERGKLEDAYRAVMKVAGERRGRPAGRKTVQAKLLLPAGVYAALKKAARQADTTMSSFAAESIQAQIRRASSADTASKA
jgi:hypothetical protein